MRFEVKKRNTPIATLIKNYAKKRMFHNRKAGDDYDNPERVSPQRTTILY